MTEQQLNADLTRAMKAREMPRVYVLRGLLTAIKNRRVERRGAELGDADLLEIVRREIRQRFHRALSTGLEAPSPRVKLNFSLCVRPGQ